MGGGRHVKCRCRQLAVRQHRCHTTVHARDTAPAAHNRYSAIVQPAGERSSRPHERQPTTAATRGRAVEPTCATAPATPSHVHPYRPGHPHRSRTRRYPHYGTSGYAASRRLRGDATACSRSARRHVSQSTARVHTCTCDGTGPLGCTLRDTTRSVNVYTYTVITVQPARVQRSKQLSWERGQDAGAGQVASWGNLRAPLLAPSFAVAHRRRNSVFSSPDLGERHAQLVGRVRIFSIASSRTKRLPNNNSKRTAPLSSLPHA